MSARGIVVLCLALLAPTLSTAEVKRVRHVYILLDNSISMRDQPGNLYTGLWPRLRPETIEYVRSLKAEPDRDTLVFLYLFDDGGRTFYEVTLDNRSPGPALVAEVERKVPQQPNAMGTPLYNSMFAMCERIQATAPTPGLSQRMWVFTDGKDFCEEHPNHRHCGRQFKTRAQLDKCLDGLTVRHADFKWVIATKESVRDDTAWHVTPRLSLSASRFGVQEREVTGTVELTTNQKGLLPYEVRLKWTPTGDMADCGNPDTPPCPVTFVPPGSVGNFNPSGSFKMIFHPDLSRPRPAKITGKLEVIPYEGKVQVLGEAGLDVEIPVDRVRWTETVPVTAPYRASGAIETVEADIPADLWNVVSRLPGLETLEFKPPKVSVSGPKQLGAVKARIDSKALKKGKFAISLKGPRVTRRINEGSVGLSLRDENDWLSIQKISIPVNAGWDPVRCKHDERLVAGTGAKPPRCEPALDASSCKPPTVATDTDDNGVEDECVEEAEPASWLPLLLALAGLLLLLGIYLMLRKPNARWVGLEKLGELQVDRPFPILKNGSLRLTIPRGEFPLSRIADPDELENAASAGKGQSSETEDDEDWDLDEDESDQPGPSASPASESATGEFDGDYSAIVVKAHLAKDGTVVLTSPAPVFRRPDAPPADGREYEESLVVGRIVAGRLIARSPFRVLRQGPLTTAVDLRSDGKKSDKPGPAPGPSSDPFAAGPAADDFGDEYSSAADDDFDTRDAVDREVYAAPARDDDDEFDEFEDDEFK